MKRSGKNSSNTVHFNSCSPTSNNSDNSKINNKEKLLKSADFENELISAPHNSKALQYENRSLNSSDLNKEKGDDVENKISSL